MAEAGNSGPVKKVGFWEMIRDVLVASMNKGQFPMAIVGGIVLMLIWRMPTADVGKLVLQMLQELHDGYLFGYGLALFLAFGWYAHSKRIRKTCATELARVCKERNNAQEQLLGLKLTSSRRK